MLSGGGVRPTSNVNIVSIFLKEVSMVEIRLSSVTADITEVVGLAVDILREREALYAFLLSLTVTNVETDPTSNCGINVLEGAGGRSSVSVSRVKST